MIKIYDVDGDKKKTPTMQEKYREMYERSRKFTPSVIIFSLSMHHASWPHAGYFASNYVTHRGAQKEGQKLR